MVRAKKLRKIDSLLFTLIFPLLTQNNEIEKICDIICTDLSYIIENFIKICVKF